MLNKEMLMNKKKGGMDPFKISITVGKIGVDTDTGTGCWYYGLEKPNESGGIAAGTVGDATYNSKDLGYVVGILCAIHQSGQTDDYIEGAIETTRTFPTDSAATILYRPDTQQKLDFTFLITAHSSIKNRYTFKLTQKEVDFFTEDDVGKTIDVYFFNTSWLSMNYYPKVLIPLTIVRYPDILVTEDSTYPRLIFQTSNVSPTYINLERFAENDPELPFTDLCWYFPEFTSYEYIRVKAPCAHLGVFGPDSINITVADTYQSNITDSLSTTESEFPSTSLYTNFYPVDPTRPMQIGFVFREFYND